MSDPAVLRHVIGAITPASVAHGAAARRRVAAAGAPVLERLAAAIGAAQHTSRPRTARRTIVVCAGDHGVGDPGIALGPAHPTVIAARAIADGSAALAQLARASRAPIVLVDAGAREPAELPASAIRLGRRPSGDLMAGPAMTVVDAALALEAGIALAVALADDGIGVSPRQPDAPRGLERSEGGGRGPAGSAGGAGGEAPRGIDVIAVGALGVGADVASAALLGAATGAPPTGLADPLAEAAGAQGAALAGASALELLAAFGGPETGVLAGLMLAAASTNVPVILDGYATGAAALIAVALAPSTAGYLIAAHAGSFTHSRILTHLGLHPVFELGLGHGEGTGAAMALALIDHMAAVASRG
ncbi:MAG TPA: nicotinate-nucleotide--dimethylbenzimidazole phosphoribosyltransferase [Kofleriaceae bacterium]|nr:nicotinate-nucleotide--dimethylbenzimidazole phosphoribosyltransferase [Kofleriaceae bacterium]